MNCSAKLAYVIFFVAVQSALAQRVEIYESYPRTIGQKIATRNQALMELLKKNNGGIGLEYIVMDLQRWYPGQMLRVAFRGGSKELRIGIMETAKAWCDAGNIKLDWGYNAQDGTFREWSAADASFSAELRVAFDEAGYWSLVGSDSIDTHIIDPSRPSLNLGAFDIKRPANWNHIVLHEFGHALGFQHEHQRPADGCENEFRWEDDKDYVNTTDASGQFVEDQMHRRPGVYTWFAGYPNFWKPKQVDDNLRNLSSSHAYTSGPFDPESVMLYCFQDWLYVNGKASRCFHVELQTLSKLDREGIQRVYPSSPSGIERLTQKKDNTLKTLRAFNGIDASFIKHIDDQRLLAQPK